MTVIRARKGVVYNVWQWILAKFVFAMFRLYSDNLLQATERCSIPIILASESKIIVHTNPKFEITIRMFNACMDHCFSLPFNSDHVVACFAGRYSMCSS